MKIDKDDVGDIVPALLTMEQVVQLMQVSERSIDRLKSDKQIPGVVRLLKRTVRFRRDVIEEWIAADCPAIETSDQ